MAGEPPALDPEQLANLYREVVAPIVFDDVPDGQAAPTLLLLGGQSGAGKSRLTGRILEQFDGMAALTGDDLRVFHPDYRTLITAQPQQAGAVLAEATRTWVRAALDDAVTTRRSLLLEGSFGDPDVTLATATRFRQAGFRVRVVAIAAMVALIVAMVAATTAMSAERVQVARVQFQAPAGHQEGARHPAGRQAHNAVACGEGLLDQRDVGHEFNVPAGRGSFKAPDKSDPAVSFRRRSIRRSQWRRWRIRPRTATSARRRGHRDRSP